MKEQHQTEYQREDHILHALGTRWSLIPCREDKKPIYGWRKFQARKPSREELNQGILPWSRAWAVVTGTVSNLVVLDFDGEEGRQTMESLGLKPHVRTPSGGYHVYYEHPGTTVQTVNGKSSPELGKLYPGMDIKGDGGYAIALGYNTRGQYEWLRHQTEICPFEELPGDLRDFLTAERQLPVSRPIGDSGSTVSPELRLRQAIRKVVDLERPRNDTGYWLACRLAESGLSSDDAAPLMEQYVKSVPETNQNVKGGAKLDHFGGAKLDQLEMEPRFCFEFLWDGWNVA